MLKFGNTSAIAGMSGSSGIRRAGNRDEADVIVVAVGYQLSGISEVHGNAAGQGIEHRWAAAVIGYMDHIQSHSFRERRADEVTD